MQVTVKMIWMGARKQLLVANVRKWFTGQSEVPIVLAVCRADLRYLLANYLLMSIKTSTLPVKPNKMNERIVIVLLKIVCSVVDSRGNNFPLEKVSANFNQFFCFSWSKGVSTDQTGLWKCSLYFDKELCKSRMKFCFSWSRSALYSGHRVAMP